jgi:hypothetical protein
MENISIPYWRAMGLSVFGEDDSPVNAYIRTWAEYVKFDWLGNTYPSKAAQLVGLDLGHFDAKYLRTDLLIPSVWREAYLLKWAKVDIEKTWDSLELDQQRLQVMHTIELMHRKTVPHEGLDAAFASWQKRNK